MKKRLLELIEILGRHGPISLEEVAAALGKSSEYIAPERLEAVKERLAEAEARLTLEKASREYHEDELAELESSLTLERDLVKESLLRIARLERQLKDAQRTTVKLIAASRSSLANLKRVRAEFVSEDFAQQALNPLVRDLEQVAQTIQELHTLALVRAAPAPVEAPGA
ncbi:MAG TPA: hypothetical protein VIB49_08680 [Thermoplasmata archaeon]|jgi:chromosome segregation ATPase